MINLKDIHSLSDFQRNAREHVERLRETGRPEVLTVHGQAELVIQHADACQKLLHLAAHASAIVGFSGGSRGCTWAPAKTPRMRSHRWSVS